MTFSELSQKGISVVARKLRIESLEVRRLFAIDLNSASTDAYTDISNAAVPNETADSAVADETPITTTSNNSVMDSVAAAYDVSALRLAGPIMVDRLAGPMSGNTDEYTVVARQDYSTQTTNLYITKRQANGAALETGVLKIDRVVSSMHRLGDKFVLTAAEYVNNPDPDSPFISWSNRRIYVVDPASRKIVFETKFSGRTSNAVELANSLVLEVTPSYNLKSWAENSPDFSAVGNAEGLLATPELVFLRETNEGIQIRREPFVEAHTFEHFDDIVISYTRKSQTNPNSPLSALKFWDISNNQLREIGSINFAAAPYDHELMRLLTRSPDGTRLLYSRKSFGWAESREVSEESLVVVEFGKGGANFLVSITPPPDLYTASLISEHQILFWLNGDQPEAQIMDISELSRPVLSTPSPSQPTNGTPSDHQIFARVSDNLSEVHIVNNSDMSRPTLTTINLTNPMYLYSYEVLDSGHLVLLGYTPGTGYVISDTMNGHSGHTTGYDDGPIHGALVIVDLQQNKITDEKLLDPHSRIVQEFPVSSLPNHFAFRTITSLPVYRSHETVHVATVDEQGKLVIVDEAKIGSDWTEQRSNGSTLTILEYNYLEVRSWSNIGQKLWRIDFESLDSGSTTDITSTPYVPPQENSRSAVSELVSTTAIPNDIPLDTNGDSIISPIDVLQVINHINHAYSRGETDPLLNIATSAIKRFDVDGDNKILPADVMMMIASLNVVHANFDTIDEAPSTTELPEVPRFWDKLAETQNLSPDLVAASIETLFGNVLESTEASPTGEYWNWFAPLDPLADKLKQQWNVRNPNRVS